MTTFIVTNDDTGKEIEIDSANTLQGINNILDSVSSEDMTRKAEQERNPLKKRMMMLYAKRKAEIESLKQESE